MRKAKLHVREIQRPAPLATAFAAGLPLVAGSFMLPGAQAAPEAGIDAGSVDSVLQSAVQEYKDGKYFVVLKDDPALTYTGGEKGLAPTAAPKGEFNPDSAHVRKYEQFLEGKQEKVAAAESIEVDQSFSVALNAFTADLTAEQALDLSRHPDVLGVAEKHAGGPGLLLRGVPRPAGQEGHLEGHLPRRQERGQGRGGRRDRHRLLPGPGHARG